MSAGPSKTDARRDSSKASLSQSTMPAPASGRIITSVSPVQSVISCTVGSSTTCGLDSVQPADSGVTSTV
jgi:hypothetical protein